MPMALSQAFLQLVLVAACTAYQQFQTRIPNGVAVPNPCQEDSPWPGVGHLVPGGGGARNPFGQDFERMNYNWTAVCSMDSDGDGQTNGQELGDPACQWVPGMPSPTADKLSHPGVCEPLESDNCKTRNTWLKCSPKFNCPAVNQEDVSSVTIRLPPTPVPAKETTYICFGVALPKDKDYHVIATTPVVNNSAVLHHMLVYACEGDISDSDLIKGPVECGMGSDNNKCSTLIGLWGVGFNGQCLGNQYGFLIGANGYKYAKIEMHWNNPLQAADWTDSSGMTLHYTPKLRPYAAGIVMIGQTGLEIPPQKASVSVEGTCSSYCTSALPRPLNLVESVLHMHTLGESGQVELRRDGKPSRTLSKVEQYDYGAPEYDTFDEPIELQPGDELYVKCTFKSMSRSNTTMYGEGTQDEMCYAFITYYPAIANFTTCIQYKSVNACTNVPVQCDVNTFVVSAQRIGAVCKQEPTCSESCNSTMIGALRTGCMADDMLEFLANHVSKDLLQLRGVKRWCGIKGDVPRERSTTTVEPSPPENNGVSTQPMNCWATGILVLTTSILVSMARAGKT